MATLKTQTHTSVLKALFEFIDLKNVWLLGKSKGLFGCAFEGSAGKV